nr:immunoglobulin light chain junction region [Macaca mulatta]MOW31374.1 immunoglobulin light chain junction region [Macaca mulatta]MOW31379.1 immunoglobulin light chain junction region [Macaca mulatta]MOW31471.1 immunoglobulin light chain junction region [Macaca mulatta]
DYYCYSTDSITNHGFF